MTTLSELLLSPGVFSIGSAAILGAAHALTPGHSKTVVAAYLAGIRGSAVDAFRLGTIVTFTHTASVFVLGLLAYYLMESVDLQKLSPVLQRCSGALVAGIGLWLLYQRLRPKSEVLVSSGGTAGGHNHALSLRSLGVSGGIVPCPEALSLLLISLSRGQSLYGLVLLLSFSVGLAVVLIALGLAAVYVYPHAQRFPSLVVTIPIMSALVLIVMGVALLW
ncbi:sulfite exporter TauE/SafE family protein [Bryobacter aggregatus]|uniref:HoxN/HupN/NixA family nickel/cobalt transporter n=1 Tax=Bryobacter aggregatus TaxID=360054 RepID=UPI00068F1C40|nr:sulfite exporter TauE/SafE family protein [Bryobacter aggregatus]